MHVPLGPRPAASPAHSTGRIMNNRSLDFELHEQALTDTMDGRAHICMNCSASTEWLAGIIGINMMDREIVNTTTKKKACACTSCSVSAQGMAGHRRFQSDGPRAPTGITAKTHTCTNCSASARWMAYTRLMRLECATPYTMSHSPTICVVRRVVHARRIVKLPPLPPAGPHTAMVLRTWCCAQPALCGRDAAPTHMMPHRHETRPRTHAHTHMHAHKHTPACATPRPACGWKVVMMNCAGLRGSLACLRSMRATVVRYCACWWEGTVCFRMCVCGEGWCRCNRKAWQLWCACVDGS